KDFVDFALAQFCHLHDLRNAVPDPRCTVADECDALSSGRTQPVQVHGHQFGHRIRPQKSTVDGCFGLLLHASLLVVHEDRHQFRLAPFGIECRTRAAFRSARCVFRDHPIRFVLTLAFRRAPQSPTDLRTPAIDLNGNALASEFYTCGKLTRAPQHQFVLAQPQQIIAALIGNPSHRFDVQLQAFALQFLPSKFQRGTKCSLTRHATLQAGRHAFAEAELHEFNVDAGYLFTRRVGPSFLRLAVERSNPYDQPTEEPHLDRPVASPAEWLVEFATRFLADASKLRFLHDNRQETSQYHIRSSR